MSKARVASARKALGRRKTTPKAVASYPIQTSEQRRTYSKAVFWVYSPWSMAISRGWATILW